MVGWKYSQPALLRVFSRLQSTLNVPASLSPTLILQLPIPRHFHGAALLEGIPKGMLPLDAYNELVKAGSIRHDLGQVAALQALERLHMDLENYSSPSINLVSKMLSYVSIKPRRQAPRGVYIHGGVGTGKSLVADIFYHCSPVEHKQRVPFHQFMLDVHKRLHQKRLRGDSGDNRDIIKDVAEDVLKGGWLLCFDEFQLYKNGLQRDPFLPCIEMIKENCHVHMFRPSAPDYRLIGARPDGALSTVWHIPLNKDTAQKLELSFAELAGDRPMGPTVITEGSRTIFVPRAASGIAFFTFSEICGTPKGAADYVAIAASFHTLFVSDIPKMTRAHGDLARRFIILVDVLYEQVAMGLGKFCFLTINLGACVVSSAVLIPYHNKIHLLQRVKLIVSADADPGALYRPRQEEEQIGPLGLVEKSESSPCTYAVSIHEEKDEEFAFARTVSRLYHMQSADYLSAPWAPPGKAFMIHLVSVKLKEGDLRRYNRDSDTKLNRKLLLLMMEDLNEIKSGHRNVIPELVDEMCNKLDANQDGVVIWEEFRDYFLRYGLQQE
ncbi:hypothetical protein AXG93_4893s1060 [Marchantia polymorpha subsp. ruderalis]|uniref:EF-hand domain-containing protein n=1 Tax=Marchantia polymorpha subsp. ruderalis TaxID=1480154 RepID=A0A176WHT6_MARPO|nr:hypothetical protein AXG93_4893s1060 [Marchantia polymorpha subsp. ruderalis]